MKSYAVNGEGLKYTDYHPEIKGIKVPKMEWSMRDIIKNHIFKKSIIHFFVSYLHLPCFIFDF